MANPRFKKCYDALVSAFDGISGAKSSDSISLECWNDWKAVRSAYEKNDMFWDKKEAEVEKRIRESFKM